MNRKNKTPQFMFCSVEEYLITNGVKLTKKENGR